MLGSRFHDSTEDFGGQSRRCLVLAELDPAGRDGRCYRVRVSPALSLPGRRSDEVVLSTDGSRLPGDLEGWLMVRTYAIAEHVDDVPRLDQLTEWGDGQNAATSARLPPTKEQRWQELYDTLLGFVQREGHARVPYDHVEDGVRLGRFVHNARRSYDGFADDELHWRDRLGAQPGWQWAGPRTPTASDD